MIRHKSVAKNVIVIDAVIVIETVIVDVHVNGNDTVVVIRPVDGVSQESSTTASITATVGFTFTCMATITGPITITPTSTTVASSIGSSGGHEFVTNQETST
jgi:hypothetical protein